MAKQKKKKCFTSTCAHTTGARTRLSHARHCFVSLRVSLKTSLFCSREENSGKRDREKHKNFVSFARVRQRVSATPFQSFSDKRKGWRGGERNAALKCQVEDTAGHKKNGFRIGTTRALPLKVHHTAIARNHAENHATCVPFNRAHDRQSFIGHQTHAPSLAVPRCNHTEMQINGRVSRSSAQLLTRYCDSFITPIST